MRDYKKLEIWRKAHLLTQMIYTKVVVCFPKEETYALSSQIKRAAYSIPLNIVEGCGRLTERDFARFLDQALGSAHETEYCALLSFDLGYIEGDIYNEINKQVNEVKAMLIAFIKALRSDNVKSDRS
ncbi:MAG TPA: four helix bundle protein [Chitinophaga sp.]|uniref:four helix bundle protein n=1 Tax=Chitinophaga sp. TaxID=1869181 RepID=UPI002F940792